MLEGRTLRLCVCAAAVLMIAPFMVTTLHAQRGHGGGGGGISHAGAMGGFSGMSRAAPMGPSSANIRSFSGSQSIPTVRSSSGLLSTGSGSGRTRLISGASSITSKSGTHSSRNASTMTIRNALTTKPTNAGQSHDNSHHLNGNQVTKSVQGVGPAKAIQNTAFASPSKHNAANQALSKSTFHGQFATRNSAVLLNGWWWRNRYPIVVIGWIGPLFWPYAYWDFVDYVFWPHAYDVFWPYVYDDLYVGVFGPYSYEGPASAVAPKSHGAKSRSVPAAGRATATDVVVCSERTTALTDWPVRQIMQVVEPNGDQQASLDELKIAAAKAVDVLQSGCPKVLLSTPVGRVAGMRQRLETMLQAVAIVQPPLEQFYASLSDEQKARFDAVSPQSQSGRVARAGQRPPDLSQACSEQAVGANLPINRLEQVLRPTDTQQALLTAVNDGTVKAVEFLKANCPNEQALTPPGRVAAMQQRLGAMLEAIKIVQPPLDAFYRSLTDEQKARFNQLASPQISRT